MSPKIALFPASGGLASSILAHLLRHVPASQLVLIARYPEKLEHLTREGATVRYADYEVPESLRGVFDGAGVVMLVSYASLEVDYRFEVHKRAIDSAVASGVQSIFYSSLAFAGDHLSDASVAWVMQPHLRTERYLASLAQSQSSSRPLAYTSIREGIYSESFAIYTGWLDPRNPPGSNLVSIPHDGSGPGVAWAKKDDLGEATANMLLSYVRNPAGFPYVNQTVLLSGPRVLSLADTVAVLGREIGRPLRIKEIGVDEYTRLPAGQGKNVYRGVSFDGQWATSWEAIRRGETAVPSGELAKWLGREPEDYETTIHNLVGRGY